MWRLKERSRVAITRTSPYTRLEHGVKGCYPGIEDARGGERLRLPLAAEMFDDELLELGDEHVILERHVLDNRLE